ncbi:MAG: SagB/ThcOx family dehydrogenase [Chloroflexota bacterium]
MQQAKNLGKTLNKDPQMQLPLYPRMSEDFAVLWQSRRMFVAFGGLGEVVLRGKSVENLLPQLVPLLTGRFTVDEIVARVQGFRPSAIQDALSLLFMQGLLEEGKVQDGQITRELAQSFQAQLKFYSRYIDFTRATHNRYEVLSKLQSSSVLAFVSGRGAMQMVAELAHLGLGKITIVPLNGRHEQWERLATPHMQLDVLDLDTAVLQDGKPDALRALEHALDGQKLMLLAADTPSLRLTRLLNCLAVKHDLPFLRSFITSDDVEVGPTVFPRQSPCYECAHHIGLLNLDAAETEAAAAPSNAAFLSLAEQIGASHTALFALSVLTKFIPIKSGETLFRLRPDVMALEPLPVYQLVGCPACSRAHGYDVEMRDLQVGPQHGENWPALYHLNTNDRAYRLFPKGHQMHYLSKNMKAVEGAYKKYVNRPRVLLPQFTLATLPPSFHASFASLMETAVSTTPVNLEKIGLLLQAAAGFQLLEDDNGWSVGLRVTPSAGGMASQTLYLVNFSAEGLAPGIYHFNPHERTLAQVRAGDFRQLLDTAVEDSDALPNHVAAAIIQTAAHGRVESKYVSKSFRYVHYDGGAMLQSLRVVTQLLGWQLWTTGDFYDDQVNDLLGLHTTTEFALYVGYLLATAVTA